MAAPSLRIALLLLALAGMAGCRGAEPVEQAEAAGAPAREAEGSAPATGSPSPQESGAASDLVDQSRTTALVRAADRVAPAVVAVNVIRTERIRPRSVWESFFLPPGGARRTSGLGSGFVFDPEGLVLTNDHVVRDADRIMVTLPDGRDLEAELVGTDEVTDVAVLRVEGGELPVAPLGTSRGLLIGEWAVAIGNPFGNMLSNAEPTVTAGVVSAVDRHIVPSGQDRGFYLGMIQTDASINPGNSGGPLVNALGEVIGVNSSIFSRSGGSEGLGFAIPIDRALRIADDLVRWGEVRRAWLGLNVEPLEADDWGRTRGVRISSVAPGSPAAEAGLRPGDHLLQANGERLAGPLDFEAVLLDLRAGDAVELLVAGRGPAPLRVPTVELPSLRAERITVLEELALITLTPEVRAERDVQNESGAVVVDISDRLRRSLRLQEGDVILQINNVRIRSAGDVAETFRELRRGPVRMYVERGGGLLVRDFVWR